MRKTRHRITHSCGHVQDHYLVGPRGVRDSREQWLAKSVCSDCYREEVEQARQERNAANAIKAEELGLPDLIGTPSQIAWAITLRQDALNEVLTNCRVNRTDDGELVADENPEFKWKFLLVARVRPALVALAKRGRHPQNAEEPRLFLRREMAALEAYTDLLREALLPVLYQWFARYERASWWIDHREDLGVGLYGGILSLICEDVADEAWGIALAVVDRAQGIDPDAALALTIAEQQRTEARRREEEELQRKIAAETLVLPEKAITKLVATIAIQPEYAAPYSASGDKSERQEGQIEQEYCLSLHFPEKDESFRALVRKHLFTWNSGSGRWERRFSTKQIAVERSIEMGHRLLCAGFPIRLAEQDHRQRAIRGEYKPESTRNVLKLLEGAHRGWFALQWRRYVDRDYYDAAKAIRGSRYEPPYVIVPPESWQEILDFAARYTFEISDAAQSIIDDQQEAERALLRVAPAALPAPVETPRPTGRFDAPDRLEVPDEVTVPAALLDDDEDEETA